MQLFMSESFKRLFTDTIVLWVMAGTTIVVCSSLTITAVFYQQLPPFIPLFNQQPWGEEQLAQRLFIFLPIVLASSIFFLNILFAAYTYEQMPLISRILCMTTLFVAFFALLFIVRTLLIVI